jgi:hypothetical protein
MLIDSGLHIDRSTRPAAGSAKLLRTGSHKNMIRDEVHSQSRRQDLGVRISNFHLACSVLCKLAFLDRCPQIGTARRTQKQDSSAGHRRLAIWKNARQPAKDLICGPVGAATSRADKAFHLLVNSAQPPTSGPSGGRVPAPRLRSAKYRSERDTRSTSG